VFGYFYMTKAALPHLQPGAAIVNTTSVTAYKGSPHLLDYSAAAGRVVREAKVRSEPEALIRFFDLRWSSPRRGSMSLSRTQSRDQGSSQALLHLPEADAQDRRIRRAVSTIPTLARPKARKPDRVH
jgi:hypothetical protein